MGAMDTELCSEFFERVRFGGKPIAHPDSVVDCGNARFTVLTSRLLRLEWSETGDFEDRGTYAFPTRRAPAQPFAARIKGQTLIIDTGHLLLRYEQDSGRFGAGNLSIKFELNGERQTWLPGMPNPSNLRGTRRTLDRCEGDAALQEGLLSRAGWSLFDDSRSMLFDPDDGWVTPRPDHEVQDWYFFGYGHDYKGALTEYTCFGGPVPLIPQYVLGAWWSRYWDYSDEDLKELVRGFEEHDLPLDVLVVDMDWHTPHSWTGYTWNHDLFPDPPAFLKWVHDKGLRVTLNLHPAEGVQPFEEIYARFAESMGADPDSGEAIPFCISDKTFAQNYFELLHHPMEDDGVDFWWVDWQQGETSEMKGLDPLLWLNHLHFADSTRRGLRPLLYSRWWGLGNHRYQTGFSGDTVVGWPALQFQPFFTATASNVAYGWWGHDIGGHMGGATEPELYARWVQYGALSPALRLHATKDPRAERRPWVYPDNVARAAQAAFHWRYQLVPYLYTMARVAHDTGVSLCRPMYYEVPEHKDAYAARYQYFFGDQMLAAPIVHPADPETGMAAVDVWIPPGTWIDYATKETHKGPCWVRLVGDLDRVPMLMKAGAILPLAAPFEAVAPGHMTSGTTDAIPRGRLLLSIFPGSQGSFCLYEDDGLTEAYQGGQAEWTTITTRVPAGNRWEVSIEPVEGRCEALPRCRSYEVRLEGSRRPHRVLLDGVEFDDWDYDPEALRATVQVPLRDKQQPVEIVAEAEDGLSALGNAHNREVIRSDLRRLLGDRVPEGDDGDALLEAVLRTDAPGREDALARLGGPFVRFVEFSTPEEAAQQLGRVIVGASPHLVDAYDVKATFSLFRGGTTEQCTVALARLTESQIIDVPFAWDGQIQAACWTAQVEITWRGERLCFNHHSQVLFPTVHTWQAAVYREDEKAPDLEQVASEPGPIDETLDWQSYAQRTADLTNLAQLYAVFFGPEVRAQLREGVPLAALLTTTINSPEQQEVILQFRVGGEATLYLNGHKVEGAPAKVESVPHPFFRKSRRTAVVRLQAGQNRLLVSTKPPQDGRRNWFLGAAITTPAGDLMTGLAFE